MIHQEPQPTLIVRKQDMTNIEKIIDNPFTYIGIVLMAGVIGFGVAFLIGML
jgi:hypothetical protein